MMRILLVDEYAVTAVEPRQAGMDGMALFDAIHRERHALEPAMFKLA